MKKDVGKKLIPFALPLLLVIASTTPEAATKFNEGTAEELGTDSLNSIVTTPWGG